VVEERQWHVLVRELDGSQSRYVYHRPAGELPPTVGDTIEIAPLTPVVVLDIEPKEYELERSASSGGDRRRTHASWQLAKTLPTASTS
jgi:hypothetical protein